MVGLSLSLSLCLSMAYSTESWQLWRLFIAVAPLYLADWCCRVENGSGPEGAQYLVINSVFMEFS